MSLDLFRSVELLRQTHSRYLRCLLEANIFEVIRGLGGSVEILLEVSGPGGLMKIKEGAADISRCYASSSLLVVGLLMKSECLISTLKATMLIAFDHWYLVVAEQQFVGMFRGQPLQRSGQKYYRMMKQILHPALWEKSLSLRE